MTHVAHQNLKRLSAKVTHWCRSWDLIVDETEKISQAVDQDQDQGATGSTSSWAEGLGHGSTGPCRIPLQVWVR